MGRYSRIRISLLHPVVFIGDRFHMPVVAMVMLLGLLLVLVALHWRQILHRESAAKALDAIPRPV